MKDDITKPTRVYGQSDDLLEIEGGCNGEAGCYNTTWDEPMAVFLSDGTVLAVAYAPDDRAIWKINVHEKGSLFDRLDICTDEDATPYSDIAHFRPGITWAYAVRADGGLKRAN